jgi:hypothetical protein
MFRKPYIYDCIFRSCSWSGLFIYLFIEFVTIQNKSDLKQTGRQRHDDGYSHNDIPDLVQKKWIMKSPTGVRGVVLGIFTTANQRFSRLVYNANIARRDKWNYKFVRRSVFNHKTFVLVSSNWTQFIYTCWVDNTQQLFFAIIYLKKFVLAVVVALPSYMLKVPKITLTKTTHTYLAKQVICDKRTEQDFCVTWSKPNVTPYNIHNVLFVFTQQ